MTKTLVKIFSDEKKLNVFLNEVIEHSTIHKKCQRELIDIKVVYNSYYDWIEFILIYKTNWDD